MIIREPIAGFQLGEFVSQDSQVSNGRPEETPGSPPQPDEVQPDQGDTVHPGAVPTEVPPDQLPGSD
ncbi:hypothetical protein [Erythrobacter alti]|uniref:hypothetical protein n=1 Tax=Erythrobacter alti TaxID=1896145 RepID=UPI0030F3F7DF